MMRRWQAMASVTVALSLVSILAGAPPTLARSTACTTVQAPASATVTVLSQNPGVVSIQSPGRTTGFVPTLLDALAFPGFPMFPTVSTRPVMTPGSSSMPTQQIIVCPSSPLFSPAVLVPVGVSVSSVGPLVIDPPAQGQNPSAGSAGPVQPGLIGTAPHYTVRDLAQTPARYDRQVVSVTGVVASPQVHESQQGAAFTRFTLREEAAEVPVLVWGRPALVPGGTVRVTGAFCAVAPEALNGGEPSRPLLEADLVTTITP